MSEPSDTTPENDAISAPDSEERRRILAEAVADVEAGVRAETYDTDGENTQE